jgi:hypothetical protein
VAGARGAPGRARHHDRRAQSSYDYLCVAAGSPGDLFDANEIDEILTLRVMNMTEAEKAEARRSTSGRAGSSIARGARRGRLRRLQRPCAPTARRLAPGARACACTARTRDILDSRSPARPASSPASERRPRGRVLCRVLVDAIRPRPGRDGKPGHRFLLPRRRVELT